MQQIDEEFRRMIEVARAAGRNPFPSYNWYTSDFQGSSARAIMTLEQQGAYRNLLDHAWMAKPPCSLPSEPRALANFSGLGPRWSSRGIPILQWFAEEGGRVWNRALLLTFCRAWSSRQQKQEAGKKGNKIKWGGIAPRSHSDRTGPSADIAEASLPTSTSVSSKNRSVSPVPFRSDETDERNGSSTPRERTNGTGQGPLAALESPSRIQALASTREVPFVQQDRRSSRRATPRAVTREDSLVDEIVEATGDEKSRAFFRKVVRQLPEQKVHQLSAEVRADRLAGKLNKPGAVFVTKAKEAGVR